MTLVNSSSGVLNQMLRSGGIDLNLHSENRDQIFRDLIDKVAYLQKRLDAKETLFKALTEREKLCSTGLGDGVALPHTRNTISGLADYPVVVFGRHHRGIPYGALDGAPVHLLFLLIAPTVSQHLQILARLTRLLRKPDIRQALLRAGSPEEVLDIFDEAEIVLAKP
ncbi:MAG: system, fructose-specific component [Verrucomicrobiales bacterium]|nr:system, fructose-specific component [Verrucomicrobiales bacterium]